MNFPGCTNGGGQYINNTMVNQGHVPVSTLNYCVTSSSERKRQKSDERFSRGKCVCEKGIIEYI